MGGTMAAVLDDAIVKDVLASTEAQAEPADENADQDAEQNPGQNNPDVQDDVVEDPIVDQIDDNPDDNTDTVNDLSTDEPRVLFFRSAAIQATDGAFCSIFALPSHNICGLCDLQTPICM